MRVVDAAHRRSDHYAVIAREPAELGGQPPRPFTPSGLRVVVAVLALAATIFTQPAVARAPSPFATTRLYVDPVSDARLQARRWESSRPADAAAMAKIARQPQADWFGDWSADVRAAVADRVRTITSAGALPLLVAYNIPTRDCGGHSAGGASSGSAYRRWIRAFAAGLGRHGAAVVLEPDALAQLDCLSRRRRRARARLIADAVRVLGQRSGVAVYLDAGHSGWHPASVAARRLARAGVARARGFSLNVANFQTAKAEIAYGTDISARIGGKPFVVDTSRNGAGPPPGGEWCNPRGRALGHPPTGRTRRRLVDAYLWIKVPGESDGACNGGPPAGTWWPQYALGLARRAAW
jgi:endoglucanase